MKELNKRQKKILNVLKHLTQDNGLACSNIKTMMELHFDAAGIDDFKLTELLSIINLCLNVRAEASKVIIGVLERIGLLFEE